MASKNQVKRVKKAQKERFLLRELSHIYHQLSLEHEQLRGVIVSRVTLSPDKSLCTVYFFTPKGQEHFQEVLELLKLYRPSIRKAVADKLTGRYVPDIRFVFDETFEKQERFEKLMERIKSDTQNS